MGRIESEAPQRAAEFADIRADIALAQAKKGDSVKINRPARSSAALQLPDGLSEEQAIKQLQNRVKRRKEKEQVIVVTETFSTFPWDGAVALQRVLAREYEWVESVPIQTMFGPQPPEMRTVAIGFGQSTKVPWGEFALPDIEGTITTRVAYERGMLVLALHATIQRQSKNRLEEILKLVREECATNSIYRGKALKIRFRDSDGDTLGQEIIPEFIDTANIDPKGLIFSQDVELAIETSLFTPITRFHDLQANGVPFKRGVLLGGIFGTGKTLAATVAAKLAQEQGLTFVYISHANELSDALAFARHYQSPGCVVFCEDIDRALSGERTEAMDEILNTLDGIDSKNANLMVVLTSNDMSHIHPAMLRPGRIDHVIHVTPPDAAAVERLVRLYGRGLVKAGDLGRIGNTLAGQIPAVIAEVVKRAKLVEITSMPRGTLIDVIHEDALIDAAQTMEFQLSLQKANMSRPSDVPTLETLISGAMTRAISATPTQANGHETATFQQVIGLRTSVKEVNDKLKVLAEAAAGAATAAEE